MHRRLFVPTAFVVTLLSVFSVTEASAGPVAVSCGRGRQALVHDTWIRGQRVTRVECVDSGYRRRRAQSFEPTRYRLHRHHRSWGRSALIIGGSAATGAGIGGIVKGRSGALVGAALGGGVGSLYEGAHRR